MKLSVVIGTCNRLALLKQCLGSIFNETANSVKIYVTDAGSTDGTIEYLKSIASDNVIPILVGKKIGQAKALNDVFKIVDTPYVCWLSDDNLIVNGMLDTAIRILERNPDIGMVSLKVKDVVGQYIDIEYIGGIWHSGILNCNQGMLPTSVIKKVGGFDEKFRDYGIDADLTTKVLLSGYKVVFTRRVAIHHYRDHASDSWINAEERNKRTQAARILYNHKYEQLITSFDFRVCEFQGELSVQNLCRTITADIGEIPFSSQPETLYWLNELLKWKKLYWEIKSRRDINSLDPYIRKQIEELKDIYFTHKIGSDLVKLNRVILEAFYPLETPKSELIRSGCELQYDKARQLKSRKMVRMKAYYDGPFGFLLNRLGFSMRDWRNVFVGRFISDWDLIKNRFKDFYLVQQIPAELRTQAQIRED